MEGREILRGGRGGGEGKGWRERRKKRKKIGEVLGWMWPGPARVLCAGGAELPNAALFAKASFLFPPGSSGRNVEGLKDTQPEHRQRS